MSRWRAGVDCLSRRFNSNDYLVLLWLRLVYFLAGGGGGGHRQEHHHQQLVSTRLVGSTIILSNETTTTNKKNHGSAVRNKTNTDHATTTMNVITEGSCQMKFAAGEDGTVFYNPVQVQNRDLSILMIALHAERRRALELEKYQRKQQKQQQQLNQVAEEDAATNTVPVASPNENGDGSSGKNSNEIPPVVIPGLCILDALAASGLRSMRYWKECAPHVHHITINDLDPAAGERAVENVHHNGLTEHLIPSRSTATTTATPASAENETSAEEPAAVLSSATHRLHGISVQTGNAMDLLYRSRQPHRNRPHVTPISLMPPLHHHQWDVIDLDPYGSAAPFLDGAVQAVTHGGLLNITCTDMAALGGSHPETCFGRYASMPLARVGYLQEMAVRILLYSLAVSAARYGRTIHPVVSVGMDFYIRVFCEIRDDKAGVNALSLRVGQVYQSTQCPTFQCVPAGRLGGTKGNVYQPGRLRTDVCPETGGPWKIVGPIWLGPLHNRSVVQAALQKLEDPQQLPHLSTKERLRGLLQSCHEELEDAPLFYRLPDLSQTLCLGTPPVKQVQSALVNAGYRVSGYHKDPMALKTDAPSTVVWDVFRAWAHQHPSEKVAPEGSVAARILATPMTTEVDFTPAASVLQARRRREDGVARFPGNPQPNWGPKSRASGKKRKAVSSDNHNNNNTEATATTTTTTATARDE